MMASLDEQREQTRLLKSIDRNLEMLVNLNIQLINALSDEQSDDQLTGGYGALNETEPSNRNG